MKIYYSCGYFGLVLRNHIIFRKHSNMGVYHKLNLHRTGIQDIFEKLHIEKRIMFFYGNGTFYDTMEEFKYSWLSAFV